MSIKATSLLRLINEFQDSPKLIELLTAFMNCADETEDILNDLLADRSIGTATGVWLDIIGDIVGVTRSKKSINIDSLFEGYLEPIEDSNMEDVGEFNYESYFGATITKVSTPTHGVAQSLKVVNTDAMPGAGARVKYKYFLSTDFVRVTGWAYNVSSSHVAVVTSDAGAILWTAPSNSATWNEIDFTVSSVAGRIILGINTNTVSQIVYFDDMSIKETSGAERELLEDGDMELTSLEAWTKPNANTTLTKVTPGSEGTYALRVVGDSINPWHGAQQVINVPDNAEHGYIEAYGRFIGGGAVPTIWQKATSGASGGFGSQIAVGTTSTSFHKISSTFDLKDGKYFNFGGAAINTNVEYDSIYVKYTTSGIKDADSEKTGTDDWTVVDSAVLSKDAGIKYDGSQSLKIVNIVTHIGGAQQALYTNRTTFKLIGRYYSSSTSARAGIWQDGTNRFVGDATATTWLPFEIELNTADGLDITFGHATTVAGTVYYDSLFLIEDDKTSFGLISELADYDMEESGTAAWTAISSATLSKDTGIFNNGLQSLKVVNTTGSSTAAAEQEIAIPVNVGVKYLINSSLYYTAALSRMTIMRNGTPVWSSGSDLSSWTEFNYIYDPHATNGEQLQFGNTETSLAGFHFYIDDIKVTPVRDLMLDGQMEDVGTTEWTAINGATVSKYSTIPGAHFQSGTQGLGIRSNTQDGTIKAAQQTISNPGTDKFYLRGWANSFGSSTQVPAVYQNEILRWEGTTSSTFHYFDLELNTAEGLDLQFGHRSTTQEDDTWVIFDEVVCYVPHDAGGFINSYLGLLTDEPAEDDEYRLLIVAKTKLYSKGSTVADVYSYIFETFGYTSVIDNSVAGQISITTSEPLVGSERTAVLFNSPVAAGIRVILIN